MSGEVALQTKVSLVQKFADRFGVEPDKMLVTLKSTAFKSSTAISNEQMMALLIVADQYGLNPWTREIYAFPDKGGIVPVVGVDGWSRIINQDKNFDGMDFEQDDEKCTCVIYRKDRAHPIKVTEYMAECRRDNSSPWKSHPKRMLRHKAMIQCARVAFGFVGIFDEDEAERIINPIPAWGVSDEEYNKLAETWSDSVTALNDAFAEENYILAAEIYSEIPHEVYATLQNRAPTKGGCLTTLARKMIKESSEFNNEHRRIIAANNSIVGEYTEVSGE